MEKKKIPLMAVVVVAVVMFVIVIAAFYWRRSSGDLVKPEVAKLDQVEEQQMTLNTWEDPAGFAFSYPEDVQIDPHDEDEENYAHLELGAVGREGKITIWMKDTSSGEIEDWLKKEALPGGRVVDTQLGGKPAKKIAYLDPEKLAVAAIDVDAVALVEMTPDRESYWQEVFEQILTSFVFIPLKGEDAAAPGAWGGGGGAGGIIEEDEEVIE